MCAFSLLLKKNNSDFLKPLVTDDGFESFNGNGTSNSDNESNNRKVHLENESHFTETNNVNDIKRTILCSNRQKKIKCNSTSSDEEDSNSETEHAKKPKVMVCCYFSAC